MAQIAKAAVAAGENAQLQQPQDVDASGTHKQGAQGSGAAQQGIGGAMKAPVKVQPAKMIQLPPVPETVQADQLLGVVQCFLEDCCISLQWKAAHLIIVAWKWVGSQSDCCGDSMLTCSIMWMG